MRCLDIHLKLVKYFKFCYVFMCAYVNIGLYFYIDPPKNEGLDIVPSTFPANKTQ